MSYVHLSLAERHYIEIERKAGTSMNQMAKALGSLFQYEMALNGSRDSKEKRP